MYKSFEDIQKQTICFEQKSRSQSKIVDEEKRGSLLRVKEEAKEQTMRKQLLTCKIYYLQWLRPKNRLLKINTE